MPRCAKPRVSDHARNRGCGQRPGQIPSRSVIVEGLTDTLVKGHGAVAEVKTWS